MTAAMAPRRVAERIVWARKRKGVSQERLAGIIGTSRRHMIRLEKGVHAPGPGFRQRLSEALDQPAEFFSPDDDEEDALPDLDAFLRRYVRRIVAEHTPTGRTT